MENESHLLHDPETGDWIVSAPRRAKRPSSVESSKSPPKVGQPLAEKVTDIFSPTRLKREKVITIFGRGRDRITVIENKFPVFVRGKGVSGYQELLVEGMRVRSFATFSVVQIAQVLRAYAARAKAIRRMRGMKSLIIFKNEGREAGASQPHPHSQIFALAFVPKRYGSQKSKVYKVKSRLSSHLIIFSDRYAVAYANPTPRFPYEARIMTRRRIDNLTKATSKEVTSLAKALHACLAFVRKRKFAYNFYFHDVFANAQEHFEIRFTPRGVNVWGGFELDAGIAVNPVTPEQAAEEYRAAFEK